MALNDLVLEGFVNSFGEKRGLTHLSQDELFEAFATSSILRKHHQWDVSDLVDSVLIGGTGDGGIDAVAVLVNGRPVRTQEDVDFFADKLRRFEVDFVFFQVKSSPRFHAKDMGHFMFGVEQFFLGALSSNSKIEFNSDVQELIELTSYIFRQSIKMQENPRCHLYYVTSGRWAGAKDLIGRLEAGQNQLKGAPGELVTA